eukprot:6794870-Prorocentrum_lima.AAC.1
MAGEGDGVEVVLATVNGQLASFRFELQDPATNVKQRVQEESGYPTDPQQLLLHGGGIVGEEIVLESLPRPLLLSLVLLPFNKA